MRVIVPLALLLAATAAQAQAPDMRGMYGAPTMEVAQQLGRQGFQMGRSFTNRGMTHTYFLHPNTGRCLLQTARDNRTVAIEEQPMQACMGGGGALPPGYRPDPGYGRPGYQGPGYQGPGYQGPGNNIYGEFIGMRQRDAERELRRRDYRRAGGSGGTQYWWHQQRGLCAAVYVGGGYVRQMNPEDPRACRR